MSDIKQLVGKVFRSVTNDGERITFEGDESWALYHEQDCCESVRVEDVCGNLSDLEGTEIVSASEDSAEVGDTYDGDQRWTFYHLRTHKGSVTIRFYGTSNGYYSTAVTLSRVGGEP